ncbi:MAG: XRE family transcriptional regulator [Legionella sp.]|nr:MAG: XRE family transcriptional regulator [Legionella sp.]
MEKVDLSKQFSYRLHEAMMAAGFHSPRSTSGINIHKLADITGYSVQICRKYLRGEAIPEPAKLVDIAAALQVSPGWLLFGDAHDDSYSKNARLNISKELLHYILKKSASLYNSHLNALEVSDFLLDLIIDLSQINANQEQSIKIIDLALTSVAHFNHSQGKK